MIEPIFRKTNRLFVLSFKNGDADSPRNFFDECCMPLVEMKDINALNHFLISQLKTRKKHMKDVSKFQEMMTIQHEIY